MPMGLVESPRDLDSEPQDLLEGKRALLQPIGERLAFEVLHDQEVDPVMPADVVEDADVGMAQGRDGPGLALEALPPLGAGREVRGEYLDGDGPVEACVAGPVDLAHAARA